MNENNNEVVISKYTYEEFADIGKEYIDKQAKSLSTFIDKVTGRYNVRKIEELITKQAMYNEAFATKVLDITEYVSNNEKEIDYLKNELKSLEKRISRVTIVGSIMLLLTLIINLII